MTGGLYTVLLGAMALAADPAVGPDKYFKIVVVDRQTGRGVPQVELRSVNNIRYLTDSNGIVAFFEPGLMDRRVFFHVQSHGYRFPKDGFGYRGKALQTTSGGSATLKIERINVAQRLYRVTGAGIYRDSVLVGHAVPTRRPLINALVVGQDSVLTAVYRGKVYWFWGDTNRPSYPLGNFHAPGATSELPASGGLDPEVGVDLAYFVDEKGFARPTAKMPGKGPTWLDALVTLRDQTGHQRMFARYVKVAKPMRIYQQGLAEFNDETKRFEKLVEFPIDSPLVPDGHPLKHTVDGVEYVYFANPYPLVRVRATVEDLRRLSSYEAFTCLKTGSRLADPRLDRAEDGSLRYGWKRNTPAVGAQDQAKLIRGGHLKPEEALLQLQDRDTGQAVFAHRGSVYWNGYRKKWVMIAVQSGGTSLLGEVWYSEADAPLGPWVYATKVVTHQMYSFYNPKQHPMFDKHGGRTIFFEGTYVTTFSGNPDKTPRYDYNQIMYKLDLSDPRLAIPAPVFELSRGLPERFGMQRQAGPGPGGKEIAFFALKRPVEGKTVAVCRGKTQQGGYFLQVGAAPEDRRTVVLHALPVDAKPRPKTVRPLYEFSSPRDNRRAYSTDPSWSAPGFDRKGRAICLVWPNPGRSGLPGAADR